VFHPEQHAIPAPPAAQQHSVRIEFVGDGVQVSEYVGGRVIVI
jgi:hypothetical protein